MILHSTFSPVRKSAQRNIYMTTAIIIEDILPLDRKTVVHIPINLSQTYFEMQLEIRRQHLHPKVHFLNH